MILKFSVLQEEVSTLLGTSLLFYLVGLGVKDARLGGVGDEIPVWGPVGLDHLQLNVSPAGVIGLLVKFSQDRLCGLIRSG